MSVAIDVCRGGQTIDSFTLSNQPFITKTYVPTAELIGAKWLPLILRAAGLVIDAENRQRVLEELDLMDDRAKRHVRAPDVRYIVRVNEKIRTAIRQKMMDDEVTLYVG
jgi:hypothetical protein